MISLVPPTGLELVCWADFWCNRHCKTSPVVLEGVWCQVWPNIGRKPTPKFPASLPSGTRLFCLFPTSLEARLVTKRQPGRGLALVEVLAPKVAFGCPSAVRIACQVPFSLAVQWQFGILILGLVFGRFSAKLGPKAPLERRGSSCSAGCTKNQPAD